MSIDWTHFTPWSSLAGGLLIGAAAAVLVLLSGRIAGISGIVGGLLALRRGDIAWRLAFIGGLLVAPVALFFHSMNPRIDAGLGTLALAGLLVGLGTRYGSGCTSGHGVCGAVAPVAALAGRHRRLHGRRHRHRLRHAAHPYMNALAAFAAGLIFGVGLILSGMTDPGKVIGFLDLAGRWDPSLAFVMGGAILVGYFSFAAAGKRGRTFLGSCIAPRHRCAPGGG